MPMPNPYPRWHPAHKIVARMPGFREEPKMGLTNAELKAMAQLDNLYHIKRELETANKLKAIELLLLAAPDAPLSDSHMAFLRDLAP